ncbi:MAG: AbrB/MazE/SpoVT family DNA-binding domain-containing protein [Candidatus Nanopelagicaceae bacterium]
MLPSHTSWKIKQKTKNVGLPAMTMPENTLNDTTLNTSYTVTLEEDGDDCILPLPDELIDQLGWEEGDILDWEVNTDDNTITIRKLDSWNSAQNVEINGIED